MSPHRLAGHRRAIASVVCLLVVAVGILGVVWGTTHRYRQTAATPSGVRSGAPESPESTGAANPATPGATTPILPPLGGGTVRGAATAPPPSSIQIPAIGVRSQLLHLGQNNDGTVAVPSDAQASKAAWYTGSPAPGAAGPAVIEGHITGSKGKAVFYRLTSMRSGDKVQIAQVSGKVITFDVYQVKTYAKDKFPTAQVYGNTQTPELRLITCGGDFNPATGHFRDNTVVYARQAG